MAFNLLVVGAGVMGSNHIRVASSFDSIKVHVADISKDALANMKTRFPNIETFMDAESAIKNRNIDGCVIATPTPYHLETSLEAIEAGIPVLVEKPLATTVGDAKKIVQAAKARGVLLQVGHVERFNPAINKLKQTIDNIGEVVYASAHRFGVPSHRKLDNVILDLAVHDIDAISFLTGERPQTVMGAEKTIISSEKDLSTLIFEYGTFIATVESNTAIPIKVRELSLMGKSGIARLNYISQDLSIFRAEGGKFSYGTFDELMTRVGKGVEVKTFIHKEEPLKLELESFMRCAKDGLEPVAGGEDGLYVVAAAEAAIRASATGEKEKITF